MKGFELTEDEIYEMLCTLKDELEVDIGAFDGEVYVDLDGVYKSVVVKFNEEKYVSTSAVVRKLEHFFEQSKFDRDGFSIESEMMPSLVEIKFRNEG